MKRLFRIALMGLLFIGLFSSPAVAGGDFVKVMTRNQYLGTDLTPVILAQTPQEFIAAATAALAQIAANDFPLRARRLATEVALTKPDLIALQEVYDFTLNGGNFGPPFVNHLEETLAALNDKNQNYKVAATLNNLDISLPIPGIGLVRVLDRDVILIREDLDFTLLDGHISEGGLCGVQIQNPVSVPPFPSMLESMSSEDGCNYTIAVQVSLPFPPPNDTLVIERGFVGVDTTVRGRQYRFVNTHLEQRQPDPTNPGSAIFQSLQAVELIGTLLATTPPDRTLILLGDFNSGPENLPIGGITPPYQIITGQGFADIWGTNPLTRFDPEGFTCCEDADLSNRSSVLYERVDIIFVSDTSFHPLAFVVGRVPIFPLSHPPNWASDHRGVFGKLIFREDGME
jgi:endonuclease/exonuclease/phosphatase family metal-dependent hydrolase